MQDHFSAVTSLSFTPEGDRLLTGGRDKVAILWDLASHKKLATIPVYEAIEGEQTLHRIACQGGETESAMLRRNCRSMESGSRKNVVDCLVLG